jgi:hypothetical protein
MYRVCYWSDCTKSCNCHLTNNYMTWYSHFNNKWRDLASFMSQNFKYLCNISFNCLAEWHFVYHFIITDSHAQFSISFCYGWHKIHAHMNWFYRFTELNLMIQNINKLVCLLYYVIFLSTVWQSGILIIIL